MCGSARRVEESRGGSEPAHYEADLVEGEGWDAGEGAAQRRTADGEHSLFLTSVRWKGDLRNQKNNVVFAIGRSVGRSSGGGGSRRFITTGWMRPGNRLTLGRRYLDSTDPRALWTLRELREAVLREIVRPDGRVRTPPWRCGTMSASTSTDKADRPSKKAKVDEKEC